MLRFLRRVWVDGAINALAVLSTLFLAVATLLAGQDQPDDTYWDAWGAPFILRLAAVGYIALFTFWKWLDARLEKEQKKRAEASAARLEADANLTAACQTIAALIVGYCAAATPPVAVAIDELATQFWVPRVRAGSEVIERVARFVLWDRPGSGVVWTKGKGIVGHAWANAAPFSLDLRPLRAKLALGEAAFNALPEAERLGMSYADVTKTKLYTGIAVRPLFDPDDPTTFLGLFVTDFRGNTGFDCVETAMAQYGPIDAILSGCQAILKKGYGTGAG
ncbi:MAG TPA: hypothetical protein VF549_05650 [Solirubrobacteraceae bacterium]